MVVVIILDFNRVHLLVKVPEECTMLSLIIVFQNWKDMKEKSPR